MRTLVKIIVLLLLLEAIIVNAWQNRALNSNPVESKEVSPRILDNSRVREKTASSSKRIFSSSIVTGENSSKPIRIECSVEGFEELHLLVNDAGNGTTCDWANWIDPTLHTKDGRKVALTSLNWISEKAGFGTTRVNRNAIGRPMMVNGKKVMGIGTHAPSLISYQLPPQHDFVLFTSQGALDDGGSGQGAKGKSASVVFEVYQFNPPKASARTNALDKKHFLQLASDYLKKAGLNYTNKKYSSAAGNYEAALEIIRKFHKPKCNCQISIHRDLGFCLSGANKFDEAAKHLKTALTHSKNTSQKPNTLLHLIRCFTMSGEHEKAIRHLNIAFDLEPKLLGKYEDQFYHWLGINLRAIGKREESIESLEKSKVLRVKANKTYDVSSIWHAQGRTYNELKAYEKAIECLSEALKIRSEWSKRNPKRNAALAAIYSDLAKSHISLGNYEEGLKCINEALSQRKGRPASDTLRNLGHLHFKQGHFEPAIINFKKLLAIFTKGEKPKSHPNVISTLSMLTEIYRIKGDSEQAMIYAEKFLESYNLYLKKLFYYLSPQERLNFQNRHQPMAVLASLGDAKIISRAVLRLKGIVLDSLIEDESLMMSRRNEPEVAKFLSQRNRLRRRWESVVSNPAKMQKEGDELHEEMDKLSGLISEAIGGENRARRALQVRTDMVSQALPGDACLIEFVQYKRLHKTDQNSTISFGAVILPTHGTDPRWIPLGPAEPIEEELGKFLKWANKKSLKGYPKDALPELHRLVMDPILEELPKGIDTLILSPDGILNFLPFAALHKESDQPFLTEEFDILYVSTGRDLLQSLGTKVENSAYLFADPDFRMNLEQSIPEGKLAILDSLPSKNANRDISLEEINATRIEATQLYRLLGKNHFSTSLFIGPNATEATLRQVKSPRILHLATHGFFIERQDELKNPGQEAFFRLDNTPMRRAGIALAGAQATFEAWEQGKGAPADNDGIVTAEEAAHLDLEGTWLTTLSACSTGSGLVRAGEGVLGLRRAFAQAGTQNLLITLWPVDDNRTVDFMNEFYAEALRTGDAPRALAKTQRDMLKREREKDEAEDGKLFDFQIIRYFAPFVLTFRGPLRH